MNWLILILRILHIITAVFWIGTVWFMIGYLQPAINAAGADGGRVMQRLMRQTRFLRVLPSAAGLTMLSGIVLYWLVSSGFNADFMRSGRGIALGIGGLAGIAAGVIGGAMVGRSSGRVAELGAAIEAAGGQPSQEQTAQLAVLQEQIARGTQWTAVLGVIAAIAMAAADYVDQV